MLGPLGGIRGVLGVASGLGAQPHWAPVQGPTTPTGSPEGVTYLAKAKQVTEMSSAGYYIHLELYFVTGPSALGMCIFFNRFYWFGVVGLCTLGVN